MSAPPDLAPSDSAPSDSALSNSAPSNLAGSNPGRSDLAPPDIAQAVAAIRPEIRALHRRARQGLLAIGLGSVALIALATPLFPTEAWFLIAVGTPFAALLAAGLTAFRWLPRAQSRRLMPLLAQAAGLDWSEDGAAVIDRLPHNLLPSGTAQCWESVTGAIGPRQLRLAEVTVSSGSGENRRTLFNGLVLRYETLRPLPAFLVAAEAQTAPGWLGGSTLSTGRLQPAGRIEGQGCSYDIWTAPHGRDDPVLPAILGVLSDVEGILGPGARLYSAAGGGQEIHIALTFRRNLFRMPSIFGAEAALDDRIREALADLALPLALASALLEAETRAEAAARPAS
jgi:hypothetical protein